MVKYLLMSVALLVGLGLPLQGAINSQLGKAAGNPLLATFVSFLGGLIAITLLLIATTPGVPSWNVPGKTPWYLYCGGLPGVIFVTMTLLLFPRIGATNTLAAGLVGQFIASLAFDHYGWLGVPQKPVNVMRISGVLLLFVGTLLVAKGGETTAKQDAVVHDAEIPVESGELGVES